MHPLKLKWQGAGGVHLFKLELQYLQGHSVVRSYFRFSQTSSSGGRPAIAVTKVGSYLTKLKCTEEVCVNVDGGLSAGVILLLIFSMRQRISIDSRMTDDVMLVCSSGWVEVEGSMWD